MTFSYQQEYQLRTGDFDRYMRLRPSSVLDIFQDVAGVDVENSPSLGFEALRAKNLFWAVTRYKLEFAANPDLHQRAIAKTWPLAPRRIGFQREYTIKDLDGNMIVKGSSEWIIMNYETRKIVNALDVYDGPMDFSTETNFDTRVKRLRKFESAEKPYLIVPQFTDIDMNGHVNNVKYVEFAMNAIEPGESDRIKTFQIDYRHEVKEGTKLSVYTKRDGNVIDVSEVAEGNDEPSCLCRIELD